MHVHCSFYLRATGLKICLAAGSLTPFIWALISFLLTNYSQTEIINTRLIKKKTCSDVANRLQTNVKYNLERGETETKRLEPDQNVIQVSYHVMLHNRHQRLWRCVWVWVWETLKWDHRHNWVTALDTYPPLITSPIRKHLHWQNHRQGLINSCLIREASLHFPQPTDSTCSMNITQSRDRRIPEQNKMDWS